MGERGHTKGPWEGRSSEIGDGVCIYTPDGYGIGKAWDLNGRPENAANARLIAAAPDMFEALEFARGVLAGRSDRSLADTLAITSIDLAIAKALAPTPTGEALENGPSTLADATKKDPGAEQREAGR